MDKLCGLHIDLSLNTVFKGELVEYSKASRNKNLKKGLSVTSIVVEQDSFQTEHRIAGNSNKLVYFRKLTLQVYSR